jgi:hypothetical protein
MSKWVSRAALDAAEVGELLERAGRYGGIPDSYLQLQLDRGHRYLDALRLVTRQLVWGTRQLNRLEGWTARTALQVTRRILGLPSRIPEQDRELVRVGAIHLRSLPHSLFRYV